MYLMGEIALSLVGAMALGFAIGWMARARLKKRPAKRRF